MEINLVSNINFGNVYRAPYSEKGIKLLQNSLKNYSAPKECIDACIENKSELYFFDVPLGIKVPNPIPISSDILSAFFENLKVLKAGNPNQPLKYIAGNHGETNGTIHAISTILGFTSITQSEAKELGIRRLKDYKWEHVDKLAQKRQEVLKSKGIDISDVFHKYIYVFTGEDLKDYLQSTTSHMNNLIDEVLSGKKPSIKERFNKFIQKRKNRQSKFESDTSEPTWEKAIKATLVADKQKTDEFNAFLSGRGIRDFESVEEIITTLKQ